jgi:uncharacterized membrane protein YcgQ (UPF0703/DUF1980 family)
MTCFKFFKIILIFSSLFFINLNLFAKDSEIVEVKEKMFATQISDICINSSSYLGKTVKYEGIFKQDAGVSGEIAGYYVIRYGPGCCGNDSPVGFEVILNGQKSAKDDDWVEVAGILEEQDYSGFKVLRLKLSSLKVLEKRGKEMVNM